MVIIKSHKIKEIGVKEIKSVDEVFEEIPQPTLPIPEVKVVPPQPEIVVETPESRRKASNIIAQARQEAEEIIESAKITARSEGYEEGKREGLQEASQNIHEALDVLSQAIKARDKIVKDAEPEVLRLSLKIAEQIIKNEVSLHRDVCLNIVSDALSRVTDRESVIVKVNHEDFEHLKKYKDRISGLLDGIKNFSVVEDSQIEPGGCIIETNLGYVDARISAKLKAIEESFKRESNGN